MTRRRPRVDHILKSKILKSLIPATLRVLQARRLYSVGRRKRAGCILHVEPSRRLIEAGGSEVRLRKIELLAAVIVVGFLCLWQLPQPVFVYPSSFLGLAMLVKTLPLTASSTGLSVS